MIVEAFKEALELGLEKPSQVVVRMFIIIDHERTGTTRAQHGLSCALCTVLEERIHNVILSDWSNA